MDISLDRSMIDYARPVLSMLSPNALTPLEGLQNKAMRIVLGCLMAGKVPVMRKEQDLSSGHSRVTQIHVLLSIRLLQLLPRPGICTVLSNEINCRVRHARSQYSILIQSNLEWKAKNCPYHSIFHYYGTLVLLTTQKQYFLHLGTKQSLIP